MDKENLYKIVAVGFILFILVTIICVVANISNIPETEASETTVCTSAPVDDIIPEQTETIHIEETTISEVPSEALSAPVSDETVSHEPWLNEDGEIDPWTYEMLAIIIYQEAGGNGSCDNCRKYVADIVLNRVNDSRFPNTIEGVLTQKKQYGSLHWTGIKWPKRASNPREKEAVQRAYDIAEEILNGYHSELYGEGYIWQAGFKQGKEGFWCCGHYYGKS